MDTNFGDSITNTVDNSIYRLGLKQVIIPAALISYGIISLESGSLKQVNLSTRKEINEHTPQRTTADNYTQYAPAVMVYGLDMAGFKGKHSFSDRTLIYTSSQLISATFVVPLKHIVKEERPDGANQLSFPSGHTATAFSSAQFLFREYRNTNLWLSLSGYPFAIFTGVYRVINDKHWVNDVVAGAGIGILSTELAYRIYPLVKSLFSFGKRNTAVMVLPFYQNKVTGISLFKKI